jgi:Tol biopolymer transport system component
MIPGRNATLRIETVEIAGGASGAISDSSSRAETPAWSADGRWIALQRRVDGNTDIYVMRPDGSELRRVTESPALDEAPTWAHDGRRLYFQSDRDGPMHIYAVDLSDGRETRISP